MADFLLLAAAEVQAVKIMRAAGRSCIVLGALLSLATLAVACKEDEETKAAKLLGTSVTQQSRIEADDLFKTRCTPCHGPTGSGDGNASANLDPKPRNFHDKAWQQSVDAEHITKIIRFGGAAVGKSPAMPANPDLTGKPAVVAALVGKIRGFGN